MYLYSTRFLAFDLKVLVIASRGIGAELMRKTLNGIDSRCRGRTTAEDVVVISEDRRGAERGGVGVVVCRRCLVEAKNINIKLPNNRVLCEADGAARSGTGEQRGSEHTKCNE